MPRDVGERFAEHGEEVLEQRRPRARCSIGPLSRSAGWKPRARATSVEHVEERSRTPRPAFAAARAAAGRCVLRIWLIVSSRSPIARRSGPPARPGREAGGHALQGQSRGEEPLDHVVVQVRRDPLALLEHERSLLLGPRLRQFDRERGLIGEAGGHLQVLRREAGPAHEPSDRQDAVHAARPSSGSTSSGPVRGVDDGASRPRSRPRGARAAAPRGGTPPGQRPGERAGTARTACRPLAHGDLDGQLLAAILRREQDCHAMSAPRAGGSARRSSSAAPAGPPGPPPGAHG